MDGEIGAKELSKKESDEISKFLKLVEKNKEALEMPKEPIRKGAGLTQSAPLKLKNVYSTLSDVFGLKTENHDTTIIVVFFDSTIQNGPLWQKINLQDGRVIVMKVYMFKNTNVSTSPTYINFPIGGGLPPLEGLYNASSAQHGWMYHVPNEKIGDTVFYNDDASKQIPLSQISIPSPHVNRNIAVYVPGNRISLTKWHTIPKDIVKAKCMTEHWDKVVNPWLYLQSNRATYDIHRDVRHFTTRAGVGELTLRDCRSIRDNPPLEGNVNNLVREVQQKQVEVDNIFFKRALISEHDGALFDGRMYRRVWRGMTVQYNANPLGDYQILNYLHTTIDKNITMQFIDGNPNATIYYFDVMPGIPYISYDNNPFQSKFNLAEKEIMFMRNVVARPLSPRAINPAIDPHYHSQHLLLIPSPNMLAQLKISHFDNVINKYDSTSMYFTDISDTIFRLCGSRIANVVFEGGRTKKNKQKKQKTMKVKLYI